MLPRAEVGGITIERLLPKLRQQKQSCFVKSWTWEGEGEE